MKNSENKPMHPAFKIWLVVSAIVFMIGTAGCVFGEMSDVFMGMASLGAVGLLTMIVIHLILSAIDTMKRYLGKDKITLRDFFAPLTFSAPRTTHIMNYRRITAIFNLAFIPVNILSFTYASILMIPIALHGIVSMIILANIKLPYTEREAEVADMWESICFFSIVLDGLSTLVAMGLGTILGIL